MPFSQLPCFFVGELVTLEGVHSVCARKCKLCIEDRGSSVRRKNRAGLLLESRECFFKK